MVVLLEHIKSGKNPFFKEVKGLKARKNRAQSRLFVIEGLRFVEEGIRAGVDIQSLIMTEDFYRKVVEGEHDSSGSWQVIRDYIRKNEGLRRGEGGPVLFSENIFQEVCSTDNPQGVLAVVRIPYDTGLDAVASELENWSFVVVLDTLQDPGNMGTVIRTGDAAGVDCVILSEGCVDVYNPKTLRATMGSVFHVPVVKGGSCLEIVKRLQEKGYKIFASHLEGSMSIFQADFSGKIAVVIGNEGRGIDDSVAKAADCLVKIPMPGKAESLNASVAAGILLYEVVRKKNI